MDTVRVNFRDLCDVEIGHPHVHFTISFLQMLHGDETISVLTLKILDSTTV